jgi:hypothetical protein
VAPEVVSRLRETALRHWRWAAIGLERGTIPAQAKSNPYAHAPEAEQELLQQSAFL